MPGFGSISLLPDRAHSVFQMGLGGEGMEKLAYHVHMGNLYPKKSPAATNSSVAHEQKDVNELDDRTRTGCDTVVFFEFALSKNLE